MTKRLFKNARIFSAQEQDDKLHQALVVDGEKVAFLGSDAEAAAHAADAEVTDLKGAVVLPGLIDGHTHLVHFGGSLAKIDCLSLSAAQIQEKLRAARAENPNAKMICGKSFLFDAIGAPPHRSILDEAVPDIPVLIESACLHNHWVNTAALRAFGVTHDTPNPKGGEIVRDKDGEATGLLKEQAHFEFAWPFIANQTTLEQRLTMLKDVFESYLSTGVTGCIEMALIAPDLAAIEALYDKLGGRLPIRVSAHWFMFPDGTDESRAEQVRTAQAHRERLAHMSPWFRILGIKVISDGVIDSCTAFLSEPYADGTTPGPIWPKDELSKVIVLADSLDMQVAVHALGDAASAQALDCFEDAIKANGERAAGSPNERRHRMEHLECITSESITRMSRLGITASLQPVHADPVYLANWMEVMGHDHRCDRAFPWAEFVEKGTRVSFGSDVPVAPHYPLPNVYTATTRRSSVNPKLPEPTDPKVLALDRLAVRLENALRFYSSGSAHSVRHETLCGSLAPGLSADFSILDTKVDPWRDGVNSLREAQAAVTETWIAGQRAWERK